jgi:hypothetical protein
MSINSLTNAAAARRADFAPLDALPRNYSEIASAAAVMPAAGVGGSLTRHLFGNAFLTKTKNPD